MMINNTQCDMYQQQKRFVRKKKPQKSYYLKTKQTNPKVNEDFLQF